MSELQIGDKVQTGISIVCHSSLVMKLCGSILFIVEVNFEKDKLAMKLKKHNHSDL